MFVVGAGRVGRALIVEMQNRGVEVVGAWNRYPDSASETIELLDVPTTYGALPDTNEADIVLVTVPDRIVAPISRALAEQKKIGAHQVVLHCSGALPGSDLRHDPSRPWSVASFHPLQTFAGTDLTPREYFVAIEGEDGAKRLAIRLARALGHPPLFVPTDKKPLYHAAACVASNYLVALEGAAVDMMSRAGIPYRTALRALGYLMAGTLQNLVDQGPYAALTGPIARGDSEVVASHLHALDMDGPDLQTLYQVLGRYTFAMTLGSRGAPLDAEGIRDLLLGGPDSRNSAGQAEDPPVPEPVDQQLDGGAAESRGESPGGE